MSLEKPTLHEAPLVASLQQDPTKMSDDELRAYTEKIRALRAVPATRTAARKASSRAVSAQNKGIDINSLF